MVRIRYKKTHALGYLLPRDLDCAATLGYRWGLKILEYNEAGNRYIWVVDHNHLNRKGCPKLAAELQLERSTYGFWQVGLAVVDREFRGQDLACKIYKFLLRKGYILRAGSEQSPGGRYIWYRLAQSKSIEVVGRPKWSRKLYPLKANHSTREVCHPDIDVYDSFRESMMLARAK